MTRGRSAFSYMTDMASPGAGASVVMATCSDERHPPHDALDEDEPVGFKPAFEVELADKGASRLQTEVHQVNCRAKFLKFIIGSGWGDFASVHRISVF